MDDENKNKKSEAALREERVLEFWQKNKVFNKTLEKDSPKGEFVFYDGPPTANGVPGIHHLVPQSFKDAIPRYKTMQGFHVRRKGGWDTHGLPVELQVEKQLGLKSKKEIENYGIAEFNQKCKESVWKYVDVWYKFRDRVGYWVDKDNPYVTYHNPYIESVWNVLKKVEEQKLLYKDYKVVPWCPRCGTALSSHELAQGYEEVKDLSVYVKFKVKGESDTYFLAWTTTPWTLPGNVALAVGEKIEYVKVKAGDEFYILAKERLALLENFEEVEKYKGKGLVGLEYEPLFPYLAEVVSVSEKPKLEKAYKVYGANFVNTEDGTGIVHTAVMYGQDDFVLGTEVGLPKHHLVDPEGKFIKGTGFLEGRFVKEADTNGKPTLAVDIIEDLKKRNLFFKQENYKHSYPHCWRCHTALIYYARDSWYIKMSDPKIKSELIKENQKIAWEPEYIRDGRFGEWIKDVKDWAISRERYWGTPLPVWQCEKCDKKHIVGSLDDLKNKSKKSGNKYFLIRHGEAGNNTDNFHYKDPYHKSGLTEKGRAQVKESAKKFKEDVDVVIVSPFVRAKESAEIFCKEIGFPLEKVVYEEKIQEWETSSIFEGKERAVFKKYYDRDYLKNPLEVKPDGESFAQVIRRVGDFIYHIEKKYKGKNILLVGHDGVSRALSFVCGGYTFGDLSPENNPLAPMDNAEIRKFDFTPLPHNENYELDLHRPYIDEVKLVCDCGGEMARVKEVMDVWFDSGCMPFAQDHYPFDFAQGKPFADKMILYPADFISEGIDQTRGWFYTLHAVGVLMNRGLAYKNVICLGHLLDAKGKKMSKSLGNVVDPWTMMDKYGVDTLRLWMYSVNQPGESKNFDEKTVQLLHQQVFTLLYNVLAFYELYRDKSLEKNTEPKSKNILDQWILARLNELTNLVTKNLDSYKLLEPTRAIRDFVGDLSTWYLRRSRERIKDGAANPALEQAQDGARQTLYFVLKTLAKLLAPLAPFAAEDIWLNLRGESDEASVHLATWPKGGKVDSSLLGNMKMVREVVTLGLEARQKAKIQVRQVLSKLEIKNFDLSSEYADLIKEELNIKEIKQNKKLDGEIALEIDITPELKQEGNYRELLRAVQDLRKKMGLTPKDAVNIRVETTNEGKELIKKFEKDLKKVAQASEITFKENDGDTIKIDGIEYKIKIEK